MMVLLNREEQRSLNPNIFLWKIIFELDKHTKLRDGWRDGRKFLVNCVSGNILGNNSKSLVELQFWQLFLHLFTNELEALGPFLFFCFLGMGGVVLNCEHAHTHSHTYILTRIRSHILMPTHTVTQINTHTHIYTHSHTHKSHSLTQIHTHVHTLTYTHTLIHMHILMHTHTHRNSHTHIHIHTLSCTFTLSHTHTHTHTHTPSCLCRSRGSTQRGEFHPINSSAARLHAGQALSFNLHLWHESLSALILSLFVLPAVKWIEYRAIQPWCGALTPPMWDWWTQSAWHYLTGI